MQTKINKAHRSRGPDKLQPQSVGLLTEGSSEAKPKLGPRDSVPTDAHRGHSKFPTTVILPNISHVRNDLASPWNVKSWKEYYSYPNNKKKPDNLQNYHLLEFIRELRSYRATN